MQYQTSKTYLSPPLIRWGVFGIAVLLFFLPSGKLLAQNYDRYQPLQCSGTIPAELLVRSSEKYAEQVAELDENTSKSDRKASEEFLLQSNFIMDDLLLSGKALFNDPLSIYTNSIKDYLLQDYPEVRDKIKIFVIKSPSVNAFATNNGIILFNLGLLAHLENEAQLAFILCHEFQHYIHHHPINQYVKVQDLRGNNQLFSSQALETFLLAKNQYSREMEMEADSMGLQLFLKTKYSLDEIDGVFDQLRYA
ncbi:MAG TPA: zinc metalloprotease, partial [Bacteroidetes bacterium]|nr:zinc metalloprotease [Bacteroidota bacterium]